jgi:hypothetical protein
MITTDSGMNRPVQRHRRCSDGRLTTALNAYGLLTDSVSASRPTISLGFHRRDANRAHQIEFQPATTDK